MHIYHCDSCLKFVHCICFTRAIYQTTNEYTIVMPRLENSLNWALEITQRAPEAVIRLSRRLVTRNRTFNILL